MIFMPKAGSVGPTADELREYGSPGFLEELEVANLSVITAELVYANAGKNIPQTASTTATTTTATATEESDNQEEKENTNYEPCSCTLKF
jgi:hypothetical protein